MASPKEHLILADRNGEILDIDGLVDVLRKESSRVLADDDVGLVIYVGDLEIYELKPTESGECMAGRITQISRPRFPAHVIRKQIGAKVFSVTADAIFIVRDERP